MRNLADANVCYARPTAIPATWLADNADIANQAAVVSAIEKIQSTNLHASEKSFRSSATLKCFAATKPDQSRARLAVAAAET